MHSDASFRDGGHRGGGGGITSDGGGERVVGRSPPTLFQKQQ